LPQSLSLSVCVCVCVCMCVLATFKLEMLVINHSQEGDFSTCFSTSLTFAFKKYVAYLLRQLD